MDKLEEFLSSQHSAVPGTLKNYRYAVKDFEFFSKENFEDVFLDAKKVHRTLNLLTDKLSMSTWNNYLGIYKRLAKWISDPEDEVCPKPWRKIQKKRIDWEKKLKDKWLTQEDFLKLLDAVDYARDKAMYGVCVEGALRRGELLGLRIKDVEKTSYGYDVTVSGKTGSSSFPVVLFAPLLTQWLNMHPYKRDKEAALWIASRCGKSKYHNMTGENAHAGLKSYVKRAGLSKNISLHWLRHTKITWTAKNNEVRVSDEMAKKMFRWKKSSRMYSHYTHLHGTDSKETMLALAGVKINNEKKKSSEFLQPMKCLNCGESNSATMVYCGKCGTILDEVEARMIVEKQRLLEEMMKMHIERMKHEKELKQLEKEGVDKKTLKDQKKKLDKLTELKDTKTELQIEYMNREKS